MASFILGVSKQQRSFVHSNHDGMNRIKSLLAPITNQSLRSRSAPLKGSGLRVGAVGTVAYAALNGDRFWLSVMHTLAAFALYAGVGAGAGLGFGQCRLLPGGE